MSAITITNCSGCHRIHENLEYHRMKKPLYDTGLIFTHYAICPETKSMILIEKGELDERVEKQNT